MPSKNKPSEDEPFADDEYVPVLFARNMEEAEEYCELLSDHDITARVGVDEELLEEADPDQRAASRRGMTHGVPVLVPESLLDEASEVIADREDFGDFDDQEEDDEDEEDDEFGMDEVDEDELIAGRGNDDEEEEDEEEEEEDEDSLFGGGGDDEEEDDDEDDDF